MASWADLIRDRGKPAVCEPALDSRLCDVPRRARLRARDALWDPRERSLPASNELLVSRICSVETSFN